ncbi:hypothetical protein GCM10009304_30400 [Pseudomonas matsuisoli]|uniref:Uncharacterized protein n=1 Tax=Pseudomonas matsuisoli TaxID=1515666 RepID=A0A917Q010_9PSED|nr:hypothetical protein GCM10009304_30400 [Pseudomonas matsuisoli]
MTSIDGARGARVEHCTFPLIRNIDMKNLLATIGFVVVAKAAYELYQELCTLRQEKAERESTT